MSTPGPINSLRRAVQGNVWLGRAAANPELELARLTVNELRPDIIETEELVGRSMLAELEAAARAKEGPLVIALFGTPIMLTTRAKGAARKRFITCWANGRVAGTPTAS